MDLERFITAVRRSWIWIAVVTGVFCVGAFLLASNQAPVYRASAAVFFQVEGADSTQALLQGSNYTRDQVRSYAELARKELVLDPVISELGLNRNASSLAGSIRVNVPLDTAIVEVSATAGSPQDAQALANAVAEQLGTAVEQLSQGDGSEAAAISISAQTVQQAGLPASPISPNPGRNAILGLALGLVLGLGVAFLREYFNNKVTDEDSLTRIADVPVLGQMPWSGGRGGGSVSLPLKDPALVEAVRRSATNFEFVNHSGSVRAVVVTSAQPGEGKSTVAVTLALALSASQKVLLIDADLRKPMVAERLGLESSVGMTTIITGRATLEEAIQHVGRNPNLAVVTSGAIPPNPLALIGSEAFAHLIAEARRNYDAVIIDAPPLLPVTDAALLGRVADGAILVVASRKSTTKQIARAIRHLALADVPIHGAIITKLKGKSGRLEYYGQVESAKNATPRRAAKKSEASPATPKPLAVTVRGNSR